MGEMAYHHMMFYSQNAMLQRWDICRYGSGKWSEKKNPNIYEKELGKMLGATKLDTLVLRYT